MLIYKSMNSYAWWHICLLNRIYYQYVLVEWMIKIKREGTVVVYLVGEKE